MDLFYDYWNHWMRAYHAGRLVYHQQMNTFYQDQIDTQKTWSELMIRMSENMMNQVVTSYSSTMNFYALKWMELLVPGHKSHQVGNWGSCKIDSDL